MNLFGSLLLCLVLPAAPSELEIACRRPKDAVAVVLVPVHIHVVCSRWRWCSSVLSCCSCRAGKCMQAVERLSLEQMVFMFMFAHIILLAFVLVATGLGVRLSSSPVQFACC